MKVVLKGNGFNCEMDMSQVKAVDEAYDGMTISLMNGFSVVYGDTNMPQSTKQLISNAFKITIPGGTLVVNFADFISPVSITK